jgi:hypothetical protein
VGESESRSRLARGRNRRAAEQRDEVAPPQLIRLHSVPLPARAELQDTELARISQEVPGRFCDLLEVARNTHP